jgi:hypothetical protein
MAVARKGEKREWFADKKAFLKLLEDQDQKTGFVVDPTVTPERVYEMMLSQGVRPEDNILSRDIIRARYEDEA